ncbi:MAG TPA: hypothetical protein VGP62_31185 [Bryobacteraceae bacterium]|nr:hypothetical protein [Bryobacteraceae bacterium]
MLRLRSIFAFPAGALAMVGGLSADVTPIPGPYESFIQLDGFTNGCLKCAEEVKAQTGDWSLPAYTANAGLSPGPASFLFANATAASNEVVKSSASLQFVFEFVGPSGVQIPTDIETMVKATYGGSFIGAGGSSAEIQVNVVNGPPPSRGNPFELLLAGNGFGPSNEFSGTLSFPTLPNTEYVVSMGTSVSAIEGGTGRATVDPHIFIDPTFADAANYQLIESPGIGNDLVSASTPEPGSFMLALVALAAVAILRLRARATPSAHPRGAPAGAARSF